MAICTAVYVKKQTEESEIGAARGIMFSCLFLHRWLFLLGAGATGFRAAAAAGVGLSRRQRRGWFLTRTSSGWLVSTRRCAGVKQLKIGHQVSHWDFFLRLVFCVSTDMKKTHCLHTEGQLFC